MSPVFLYDTALRDGAQAEGVSLSVLDKLRIARKLDEFGIHFIEGGWPGSNPKDEEFFAKAAREKWANSQLCAFSMTRRAGIAPQDDPNLQTIVNAQTPVVTLVGKTWDFHVEHALRVSLDENLRMIEESVAWVKSQGRRVFFDCEHFFDGLKGNRQYALKVLEAAANGGAEFLVLCDTNGGTMPDFIQSATRDALKIGPAIGIHTHNDCDLGVANALAAVEAGATQVQGVINGFGERCGNCNLTSVIGNLQLKMNRPVVSEESLKGLTSLSHYVAEITNLAPNERQPFVGRTCFAHKGGMHVDAVQKAGGRAYEHIIPESVGNERRILVSEYSGTSNVREVAQKLGSDLPKGSPEAAAILREVKQLEAQGYEFESADASFALLVRRALGKERPVFELLGVRVINELRAGSPEWITEATLKLRVGEDIQHTVAEGDGPIHALDNALRLALRGAYPQLDGIRLTDFKVRVVNTSESTAARVRVLIESANDETSWSTVGVSTNVIEASWQALTEAVSYGLSEEK
ncbi:citramalate synthase [bacterium]|nr:MAG: citramalate synthase [bacterium]